MEIPMLSSYFLCEVHVQQVQLDELYVVLSAVVAYPLAADNVLRLLVSRLKGLHQPVVRSRIRFSAPRSRLLACL